MRGIPERVLKLLRRNAKFRICFLGPAPDDPDFDDPDVPDEEVCELVISVYTDGEYREMIQAESLTLVLRDFANSIRKDRNPSLPGFYADLLRLLAKDATELADEVMASAEQKAVCQGEA